MKKIFLSQNSAELGVLKSMLGCTGIPCLIRNDDVTQTIPSASFGAELWVMNDEDYPKAHVFCERWQHPATRPPPYWMCPKCGAGSEEQFNSCWKCGTNRYA
ncbi:MAG: DUF2007 domain-containing protein [Verrucomicrobia subdivision 3 bacterium]|nr:DUF2007 domain-containing protein [Limisphaerales bacterium]